MIKLLPLIKAKIQTTHSLLPLAAFRIFFALIMFFHSIKLLERVVAYTQSDGLVFPFGGLAFISLFSPVLLNGLVYLSFVGALLVLLGWQFRWGSIVWALVSLYFLLADQLYYNNHYYLFTLFGFLLAVTDADKKWSLRVFLQKNQKQSTVPYWQYLIFQLQICIVYFYGGLAKLNSDWLSGKVMEEAILATFGTGGMASFFSSLLCYGGLAFDLGISFLLFYPPTRWIGLIGVVFFNLFNAWFFNDIGVFPIAMLTTTLLFFWPKKWLPKPEEKKKRKNTSSASWPKPVLSYALILFFVFQFLFPLRYLALSSSPEWTGQGHYFSWRMKSFHKDITQLEFQIHKTATSEILTSTNLGFDDYTRQRSAAMPVMVKQLAGIVEKAYQSQGMTNFYVTVNYQVAFNGRPPQAAIDPSINLRNVSYQMFGKNEWILPLKK